MRLIYLNFLLFLLILSCSLSAQNVGIGTETPLGELHVSRPFLWQGVDFAGSGLNDLEVQYSGYTGMDTTEYVAEVSNDGPNPNLFRWSDDGGDTWSDEIPMAVSNIDVGNGITIGFANVFGHTFGDQWSWTVWPAYPDGLIVKNGLVGIGHASPQALLHIRDGVLLIDSGRIEMINTGESLFIGEHAGENDDHTGNFNIGVGALALMANTSGVNNVAIGGSTLSENVKGNYNTAVGRFALNSNVNHSRNTSVGYSSMRYAYSIMNEINMYNSAFGYEALRGSLTPGNNSGRNNSAFGAQALLSNTSGNHNVAFGVQTLYNNSIGDYNCAIGSGALGSNTTGVENVAVGYNSLGANVDGIGNTAVGKTALAMTVSSNLNTAVGFRSLEINTAEDNTAVGGVALRLNTTGQENSAFGRSALSSNSTGSFNTAVGGHTAGSCLSCINTTSIGFGANAGADNTARIGNGSVSTIGGYANWTNVSSDARIKTNVQENVPGLSFITQLRPVTYQLDMEAIAQITRTPDSLRLIDSEALKAAEIQSGFIAQEVEAAASAVGYDFHGVAIPAADHQHYGLRYAEFVVPIVKAVQELAEENENLRRANEKLEQEVLALKKLEDRLALLEIRVDSNREN